jgi:hypothetical protein
MSRRVPTHPAAFHIGPMRLSPPILAVLLLALAASGCGPDRPSGAEAGSEAAAPSGDATADADPSSGKWRPARTPAVPATSTDGGSGADEALLAMPYLQGYRPAGEGLPVVTVHEPGAWEGLNFYTSGHAPEAVLADMDGRILHRWGYSLRKLRPELYRDPATRDQIRRIEYFRRARLLPDGSVLAIYEGLGVVKLDLDSRPVWSYEGGAHHDLDLAPDGTIWVLDREGKEIPRLGREGAVLEDQVTVLDPETGGVRRKISILEAFERSEHAALLERMPPRPDVLHTNTLEILDGRLATGPDGDPAFRAGNLLISVLELDALAVLDPEREEVVWARTGIWRKQHQPTILADGNLLLFDNTGPLREGVEERSRVLELDPRTMEVLWSFGGDRETDFFSRTLGSSQRLPNGNTLITESENGRALEVNRAGEVVWEFRSPHRAGDEDELVAVLFEMERLPADYPHFDLGAAESGR